MSLEEKKSPETLENNNEAQDPKSSLFGNIDLEKILGESGYDYYQENKQKVNTIGIVLVLVVVGLLGYNLIWKNMIVLPKEKKSIEELWRAESKAFDFNDWSTAINGDSLGLFSGFESISEEYSGYASGDIASYNLGISHLNNGDYDNAIEVLKKVSFDDELLGTISIGAIGDAYMQNGSVSDAFTYYEKAYKRRDNELTSPIYMMKAAFCLEIEEKYEEAIKIYENLYLKYPNSTLSLKAEKYMESLKLGAPVYATTKDISE
jgi:tetratricopeptide (TPR) repeat protein